MYFNTISDNRFNFKWTMFHVLLGAASTFSPWVFIAWFYIVIISNIQLALALVKYKKIQLFSLLLFYLVGLEFVARLSNTSPIIPFESGKYIMILLPALAMLVGAPVSRSLGFAMILLLLPSIFYDSTGERRFVDVVFNLGGPLGLAMGVWLFSSYHISKEMLHTIMKLIWFGTISSVIFAIIKTPDYDQIHFVLGANYSTTGGQSSNQASTIFGLGMFLSFYAWLFRLKFSGYRNVDGLFFIIFTLQGLLTLSRGGIVVAVIAILMTIWFYMQSEQISIQKKVRYFGYAVMGIVLAILIFIWVDGITGGILSQRYLGETEATSQGLKEKNFDVITSNRLSVFEDDFELWAKFPILGCGGGSSIHAREGMESMNAHIELSRLLAEQGIPGLLFFLVIVYIGINIWKNRKNYPINDVFFVLYIIAFLSSFHSAMRTYVTPLLLVLASMGMRSNVKHVY